MKKNYFLLFIFSFLLINVGISQITSSASGEWSTGATWVGGVAPTATDDVVIAAGHTISVSDANAVGKSISFGGNDALIDMNSNARLTVYGDFTLFSTSHIVFSAGWSATDAKIVFEGSAVQTLSGWSTSGGSTSFRDVIIDKTGGSVKTGGNNMKLGIQNSLHIINGTFFLDLDDDIEARWASSGLLTSNNNLNITIEANGEFDMNTSSSTHRIRSGTGLAIGTMTVHGFARFTDDDSSYGIYLTAIDVEDGGILQLSPGMEAASFRPGPITIKSGGELSLSSTSDIWDGSLVDIQAGGVFSTTASTTVFPTNFTENGTILYNRSTDDQNIIDRNYNDLRIELANAGPKNWNLAANRTVGSLSIANGGELVLTSSGGALSLTGNVDIAAGTTLTNNAGASNLILTSTDTKNSSLINEGTLVGEITVERYIQGYTDGSSSDGWHLISSPITSFTVAESDFEPVSGDDDLYQFDEANNRWLNYFDSGVPNFVAGEGYLVARKNTMTGSFTGTLNSVDITFSDLSVTSGKGEGWHILGNPFSSALVWNDGNWNLSNIAASAQVRNEAAGNYLAIISGQIIPSTNGFFIEATDASNSLTIPKLSRTHNAATNNFKSSGDKLLHIKVTNDVNTFYDLNRVGISSEATDGFDLEFDAHKLYGNALAPQLASKMNGEVFTINYLPELTSSHSLNLEFKAGIDANYILNFEGADTFDRDVFMTLEDLKAQTFTNIKEVQNYRFFGSPSDNADRFVLHLFKSALGIGDLEKTTLQVFAHNNVITVQNKTNTEGYLRVFDLSGRKIFESVLNNQEFSSYRLNIPSGAYIVHVRAGQQIAKETIIIAKN